MYMPDDEIKVSYLQAKDPDDQVQVLADLNGTDRRSMEVKLAELGLREMPPPKKGAPLLKENKVQLDYPPFSEDAARRLLKEGLTDADIADRLGVKKTTFAHWRRYAGLKANLKRLPSLPAAQPLVSPRITIQQLLDLLTTCAATYPGSSVCVRGCPVVDARCVISFSAGGELASCVELITEEKVSVK